jgi:hypothetical protein
LNLENTDVATGGAGADTFVRLATMSERSLVTDFDTSEDVVVVTPKRRTTNARAANDCHWWCHSGAF